MNNRIDRRRFLKVSAQRAALAGIAAGVAGKMQLPAIFAAEAPTIANPSTWVTALIKDFTATSPFNSLKNPANEKAWDEPLVGFSGGSDPLYALYKEKVGPFHWTPLEIFQQTFPGTPAKAEGNKVPRKRRKMSAAARKKIAAAARARWAKVKSKKQSSKTVRIAKRKISAAGRARIAAAQRARWAKIKAAKK